ncbi:MAG: hypothetical protein COA43_10095 [Robiginitomaculum sp.]|nr:MAG: hypothetical protein COA43_10095 [Robiginitomaculum sp.]
MLNLLFSPKGRVNPQEFMRGVYIITGLMVVIGLLPLLNPMLAIVGMVGILLIWCWIALCAKRFHDSGKTGWLALVVIIGFFIGSYFLGQFIQATFAGDAMAAYEAQVKAFAESGDTAGIMGLMTGDGMKSIVRKTAIPSAVGTVILSLALAFVVNKLSPHDPEENQYGPAGSVGNTFD